MSSRVGIRMYEGRAVPKSGFGHEVLVEVKDLPDGLKNVKVLKFSIPDSEMVVVSDENFPPGIDVEGMMAGFVLIEKDGVKVGSYL